MKNRYSEKLLKPSVRIKLLSCIDFFCFIFQVFYVFVKQTHLQKDLIDWFPTMQPKISIQMNFSPLIVQD